MSSDMASIFRLWYGFFREMRAVILDAFAADQGDGNLWADVRSLCDLSVHARTAPGDVIARCRGATAALTNKVPFTAEIFGAVPELRYVGVLATGTNIVDLSAARAAGVAVSNVPGYATESVAELVFALVFQFTHDIGGHAAAVKAGRWAASPDFSFFTRPLVEIAGKTLTIVGTGAIGGAVARIGEAFGMNVVRAAVPGSPRKNDRVPLTDALMIADVVTLHCPLTDATRWMVNRSFLAAMKPGALLINTGRGALVDEPALIEALASGRLGGAGLDVLADEPPRADHPLTDPRAPWASRVVVTPHIAWGTVEARTRLAAEVAKNLDAFLRGERRNRVE
jgi:glycerate dehydrogenase